MRIGLTKHQFRDGTRVVLKGERWMAEAGERPETCSESHFCGASLAYDFRHERPREIGADRTDGGGL